MIRKPAAVLFSLIVSTSLALPAMAASAPVSVKVNMARILRINAPAATVIIGNPGVADVTIQDPQTLVLTGKSYGETNLIVLDGQGNPVADTMVEVVQDLADMVTVYRGDRRGTMTCSPVCQQVIMLGDDSGFTSEAVSSSATVSGMANSN